MSPDSLDLLEKIRQQYDRGPYPRFPLEQSPKDDTDSLFIHNLVTAFYRRDRQVVGTEGKLILDAGCGSGYTSLRLAEANPGAKIVGVDLSEESIKLAGQRLEYHGFTDSQFYALSIEELSTLGLQFDYINCDEVLYLLPDLVKGLQALKSVLKPDGIMRGNLHSSLQRVMFYRAQKFFQTMGLMDNAPTDLEIGVVTETMQALKDDVVLKSMTWNPFFESEEGQERILMNHLLHGDKGFTIPELFSVLREAGLEFVSMVNWRQWDITDLFKDINDLPIFWAMSLPELSTEMRLHLFELLQPQHRLLDFWCTHTDQPEPPIKDVEQWELSDWQRAQVTLHPQLKTHRFKEDLIDCIVNHRSLDLKQYISSSALSPVLIDRSIAACFLQLWEETQPVMVLADHWLKLHPYNPVTMEPLNEQIAFDEVVQWLNRLEVFLYVLPEIPC